MKCGKITIGELIEGFCAAEQGKEFIPEKKGYDVRFPHIPSGIYKNSKDGITGYPIPQPKLFINNNYIKLDKLINSNFVIISKSDLKKISKKANQIIERLEIKFIRIKDIDDPDKLLEKLFDLYKYVLVRPDLYVYGGSNENDLSEMIESIDKSFELI